MKCLFIFIFIWLFCFFLLSYKEFFFIKYNFFKVLYLGLIVLRSFTVFEGKIVLKFNIINNVDDDFELLRKIYIIFVD